MSAETELTNNWKVMLRAAACAIHEYADSPLFDWKRDIELIRPIIKGASELNVIIQTAKEVT